MTKIEQFVVSAFERGELKSIPNEKEEIARITQIFKNSAKIMTAAKLEQCMLDNPDLPKAFIQEILVSKQTERALAEPFVFEGE